MPDQRTEHQGYPLPHQDNHMVDENGGDLERMRETFRAIDADIHAANENGRRLSDALAKHQFETFIGLEGL